MFAGSPVTTFVNRRGTFLPASSPIPFNLESIRGADVDGDGDDDIVGVNGGTIVVLRNDGAGNFAQATTPGNLSSVVEVTPSDIDGDGDSDMVFTFDTQRTVGRVGLWRQDPQANFVDVTATQLPMHAVSSTSVCAFDSDGDGDIDLHCQSFGLLHNDGMGRFARLDPRPSSVSSIGIPVDVDGDGELDVVGIGSVDSRSWQLAWWRNDAAGQVRFANLLSTAELPFDSPIIAIDLDNDGDQDILTGKDQQFVFRNEGNGVFADITANALPPSTNPQPPSNRPMTGAVAADFDQDGDVDLFLTRGIQIPQSSQDSLYLNRGNGTFADASTNISDPDNTWDAEAIDFDQDGDIDLVTANSGPLRLFENDGRANFTEVTAQRLPYLGTTRVMAIDFDGDQDDDLVLASRNSPPRLLRNDSGNFVDVSHQISAPTSPNLVAGDIDLDGDIDLLVGSGWQLNDGTGRFSASGETVRTPYQPKARLRDIDNDGDPDLIGYARNLHRQLRNVVPPRLGLHGVLRFDARSTTPGFTPLAVLLLAANRAPSPIGLGALGTLYLDPASVSVHTTVRIPGNPGVTTMRYPCPNRAALLGTTTWTQALFLNGPQPAQWQLGSLVPLAIRR